MTIAAVSSVTITHNLVASLASVVLILLALDDIQTVCRL